MPDPNKLQAKLQKSEAVAERDRAALRAKAEKKIAKIKNELRAEEASLDAWLERRREKARAKLDALGRSLSRPYRLGSPQQARHPAGTAETLT